jgi:protein gp37
MAESTLISWADATFNPWEGCTKVSPGCDHCYAEARNKRFASGVNWGPGARRRRTSPANWRKPIEWNRKARASGKPFRVFCASLADVFDNEVPAAWLRDLFNLISETPALTWMLLTKRIGNVEAMLKACGYAYGSESGRLVALPSNIWLGITVVNQEEADRDIPKQLELPARVRFLSCEPMLGYIDLRLAERNDLARWDSTGRGLPLRRIDWVICGGESGRGARFFEIDWARKLRDQCKAAGVAFFMKQVGAYPADKTLEADFQVHHRAGADPAEWPEDLRVQEFPA